MCRKSAVAAHEEDHSDKWFSAFSGKNVTWEAIGVLFTYWSFGAISSPDHDPIFGLGDGPHKIGGSG